jgi:hypothetical protein
VASKSLVEWLKILWESWRMSTWCVVCSCLRVCLSPPRGWRVRSPFIDQGGGGLQCAPRYLATWGSATCYVVEWAAVRTILASIWPSWPTLYPNSGGSRVEGRRMVAMSSDRLEGGADVGPYGVQV